ncbi:MAG: hypothetical protein Q4C67_09910 [Deinococcus sp.]|nr:hypothetical protein [Deinococcus sp.]
MAPDAAVIKLTMLDTLPPLSPAAEATGAMLLREAVTNVVRHAGASEVSVAFAAVPGGHTLTIHDNGKGGSAPEGTSLNSMRERCGPSAVRWSAMAKTARNWGPFCRQKPQRGRQAVWRRCVPSHLPSAISRLGGASDSCRPR